MLIRMTWFLELFLIFFQLDCLDITSEYVLLVFGHTLCTLNNNLTIDLSEKYVDNN